MAQKKKKTEQRSLKEQFNSSKAGMSWAELKRMYARNKGTAIGIGVVGFVIGLLITGFLGDAWAVHIAKEARYMSLEGILGKGLALIPVSAALGIATTLGLVRLLKKDYTEVTTDEETNTTRVEDQGAFGTAKKLSEKSNEFEEAFKFNEACNTTDVIYGRSLKYPNLTISPNSKEPNSNANAIFFGAAGTAKSTAVIANYIFSKALLGESIVVTDTKGELFGLYKVFLENRGYIVRYLNFNPKQVAHSDQVNLFKSATSSDEACSAAANTIVQNLNHSHKADDFWMGQQANLLTCAMLYVKNDTQGEFPKKTLAAVQKFLQTDMDTLITKFETVIAQDNAPFFSTVAKVWIGSAQAVREQTLSGLRTDIAKLGLPVIQKVLGDDEVDLVLPAKRKCAYFVDLSEDNKDLQFISSLFFDMLFSELKEYADNKRNSDGGGKYVDVRVTCLLDEFTNIGTIPNFESRISALRSRHVDLVMLCQGYEQIERRYPDKIAETILQNCHIIGFLGGKGPSTLKLLTELIGKGTVQVYKEATPDGDNKKEPKLTSREVYTEDELRRLDTKRMLIISARRNPLEVEKLQFFNHPLFKELHPIDAAYYRPNWVDKLDPREYARYGININKFDERATIAEGTYEYCTEADFAGYYHGKIGVLTENDDYAALTEAKCVTEVREAIGDEATLDEIKEALRENSLVYSKDVKKDES